SARQATVAPTCPRRSRCAPNLSTNSVDLRKRRQPGHHSCMDQRDIEAIVRRALDEDLPDITSEAIFSTADRGRARFLVKAPGVIAGLMMAEATFKAIDGTANFSVRAKDGDRVEAGAIIAEVSASVI